MTQLQAAAATRLEKTARDNGFDCEVPAEGAWLPFVSTQVPLRVWLTAGDERLTVAFSQVNVFRDLAHEGDKTTEGLPAGAVGAIAVDSFESLHHVVRRAFQLSKTLPDELLHRFESDAAKLPRSTEAERMVVQRVGQDIFREGLLDYWDCRCAMSGLAVQELLCASHIKPWARCETDAERLNVFNGLLLAPHLDALFDKGFITVEDDGSVRVSVLLPPEDRARLGLDRPLSVARLSPAHLEFLRYHRATIFRGFERTHPEVQREEGPSSRLGSKDGSQLERSSTLFDCYVGVDYSGAETPTSRLPGLRVFVATPAGEPEEQRSADGFNWTRKSLAEWLVQRLCGPERVVVGIDHAFSFPLAYFERHGIDRQWPTFLDDFCARWPTDADGVWVRDIREGRIGAGASRSGEVSWFRQTELAARGSKPVFRFDVEGQVAASTHAGLPWLRFIRQRCPKVHFWPFDGWDVPLGSSVIAEVYPSLWRAAYPRQTQFSVHQHDAYVVACWLRDADRGGELLRHLRSLQQDSDRSVAEIEGWILSVPPTGRG